MDGGWIQGEVSIIRMSARMDGGWIQGEVLLG